MPEVTVQADSSAVIVEKTDSDCSSILCYKVHINWDKVTESGEYKIRVSAAGSEVTVAVRAVVVDTSIPAGTFVETDGVVAMEAEHYGKAESVDNYSWYKLREYGKTLSSMKIYPLDRNFDELGNAPYMDYQILIREGGDYTLRGITAPTNNLEDGRNMRYAISVDGGTPEAVKTIPDEHYNIGAGHYHDRDWGEGVLNNCHYGESRIELEPGVHTIRFYGVEAGLVLQKLVLYKGELKASYFGPEESSRTSM